MPPKKTPTQAFMDSLLEMGVDSLRETIQDAFSGRGMFDPQARAQQVQRLACHAPRCGTATAGVCMSCKKPYCTKHSEWRRADGFIICHRCFQFLWLSARDAAARGAWETFQQTNPVSREAAPREAPHAAPPPTKNQNAPWEVLGIESDATEEQIKKAFRAIAAKSHPDAVPAEEREAAQETFIRASKAYDAMLAALKASQR